MLTRAKGRGVSACVCVCVLIVFKQQAKVCSGFWREDELWRHCQAAVASGTTWEVAHGHIVTTAICLLRLKWLPHTIFFRVLCFKKGIHFHSNGFHRQHLTRAGCPSSSSMLLHLSTSAFVFVPGWLCPM